MNHTKTVKRDNKGYYYRNLGWLSRGEGKKWTQPKFLLGRDERDALDRLRRLERLWECVERRHEEEFGDRKPTWTEKTLAVGKAISQGKHTFRLARQNCPGQGVEDAAQADADYAGYLQQMQEAYPVITFIPEDAEAFQNGVRKNIELAESFQSLADDFAKDAGQPSVRDMHETLHKAIRAFLVSIDENPKYKNHDGSPGAQPLTAWAYKLKFVCRDFLTRYEDRPLSSLATLEAVQALFDYWRNRPPRKGTKRPITVKTAGHRMTALSLFLKWLHRTSQFSWRKPTDFDEIDQSVNETKEEKASRAKPDQVATYSEDELVLLYQNTTTPLERLLMLLGLNCGCKQAEAGTILLSEVALEAIHPHADLLAYHSSEADSFIKRVRPKTGVYGEFKLWPHTVLGMKWLIERRQRQTKIRSGEHAGEPILLRPSSILLTTDSGYPMYRLYESGNTSQDISKCWARVVERTATAHPEIGRFTYSTLRRTTANFLRKTYGGEVANVFLQHGSPFEKDRLLEDYTNRPYGRLFEALDRYGERLRQMFEAVPDPFPSEEKKGGANITPGRIREIKRLVAEGKSKSDVARRVGVHRSTVYRYAE